MQYNLERNSGRWYGVGIDPHSISEEERTEIWRQQADAAAAELSDFTNMEWEALWVPNRTGGVIAHAIRSHNRTYWIVAAEYSLKPSGWDHTPKFDRHLRIYTSTFVLKADKASIAYAYEQWERSGEAQGEYYGPDDATYMWMSQDRVIQPFPDLRLPFLDPGQQLQAVQNITHDIFDYYGLMNNDKDSRTITDELRGDFELNFNGKDAPVHIGEGIYFVPSLYKPYIALQSHVRELERRIPPYVVMTRRRRSEKSALYRTLVNPFHALPQTMEDFRARRTFSKNERRSYQENMSALDAQYKELSKR